MYICWQTLAIVVNILMTVVALAEIIISLLTCVTVIGPDCCGPDKVKKNIYNYYSTIEA